MAACMIWPAIRAASALPPVPASSSTTQTAETGLPFLSSAKPMNQPWSGGPGPDWAVPVLPPTV